MSHMIVIQQCDDCQKSWCASLGVINQMIMELPVICPYCKSDKITSRKPNDAVRPSSVYRELAPLQTSMNKVGSFTLDIYERSVDLWVGLDRGFADDTGEAIISDAKGKP